MRLHFGDYYRQSDVKNGVHQGLASYAANNPDGFPVQLQPNDQFQLLEDKLERIAVATEAMAKNLGRPLFSGAQTAQPIHFGMNADVRTLKNVDLGYDEKGDLALSARPHGHFKGVVEGLPISLQAGASSTTLTLGRWFGKVTYTDGQRQSGKGPDSYRDYRAAHPEAPVVSGPGWQD